MIRKEQTNGLNNRISFLVLLYAHITLRAMTMLIVSRGIYLDHIGPFTTMYFVDAQCNIFPTGDTNVSHCKELHIDYVDVYRRIFTTVKTWQIIMN